MRPPSESGAATFAAEGKEVSPFDGDRQPAATSGHRHVHGWPVAVARVSEGPPSALVVDVVRGESGLVVLGLAGDLDLTTVGELRAAVERLSLSPTTGQRVVVDLSGVAFVDSSGLNGLVTSARALEGAGSTVVLAGAGAHIVRVFEIVQLDRSVTIEPSVERALGRSHGRTAATG